MCGIVGFTTAAGHDPAAAKRTAQAMADLIRHRGPDGEVVISTTSLLTSCNSCSDRRVHDVSSLPGLYEGEATIILPDHVKAMLKPDANGNTLIPEGPIPCKISITADTSIFSCFITS